MTVTQDWSDLSLIGLFRLEVETQTTVINNHLLALENKGQIDAQGLDELMRAAHSIKGAARIVQVEAVVEVAHALEDFFLVATQGTLQVRSAYVDVLLSASDFMLCLSALDDEALMAQSSTCERDTNAIVLAVENLTSGALQDVSGESSTEPVLTGAVGDQPVGQESVDHPLEGNEEETVARQVIDRQTEKTQITETQPEQIQPEQIQPEQIQPEQIQPQQIQSEQAQPKQHKSDRTVRLNADNLNRLMGLAGESVVESNWLQPFAASLLQLKRQQQQVMTRLEKLSREEDRLRQLSQKQFSQKQFNQKLTQKPVGYSEDGIAADSTQSLLLSEAMTQMQHCQQLLNEKLSELDGFSQRSLQLSDRLYREMIASHMCAFEMGTKGYGRLVRDLAKTLDKQVTLKIEGLTTQVDRALLEKLDAPIVHLLTNAIAHGIETPEKRKAAGKPAAGTITVKAFHHAGMLRIIVEDDGGGFDFAALRQKIVTKGMTPADVVDRLSEDELIEFLFLPGFSTNSGVDQYSGRGYGLDIARSMVQSVGGALLASSTPKKGTRFQFQLPLTLSVVRSLIFEVAEEPYALNLARIGRVLKLPADQIRYSENRPYFSLEDNSTDAAAAENISLIWATQLLALSTSGVSEAFDNIWVIVLGESGSRYGLCVDRLIGEKDLVVRPLDTRLGKVPHISSAALSEEGEPILILDVADVLCSAASLAEQQNSAANFTTANSTTANTDQAQGANANSRSQKSGQPLRQKKVLVVDDSMTVRAMEKKLLQNQGYAVDIAVDGADGWNAVRTQNYDLVITDIDMPRLNGIELIEKLRDYKPTQKLPVIVVSYKDRQADQLAGLAAGANYYLTKSSFHNDGLINAVVDLIGPTARLGKTRSGKTRSGKTNVGETPVRKVLDTALITRN
ncbi:MAG: hybrid sensor histidine kinase/response regulator [Cyanobacteria bacterium J06621_11]